MSDQGVLPELSEQPFRPHPPQFLNSNSIRLTCWMLVALVLTGCSAMTRQQVFDVKAVNVGGREIVQSTIEFEGFFDSFGIPGPNGYGNTNLAISAQWPKSTIASWRLAGEPDTTPLHKALVEVPQAFSEKYRQDHLSLNFEFDGESVTASIRD